MSHQTLERISSRSLAQVDQACRDGRGFDLFRNHVDQTARDFAGSVFLAILVELERSQARDFRSLAEQTQADIALTGIDFAITTREALAAAIPAPTHVLAEIERYAGERFKAHIDRFLAEVGAGGRA